MKKLATWIMVAGPYSSGATDDDSRKHNLDILNRAALSLFDRGYVPIIGVNCALPLVHADGSPGAFDRIMMPYALELAERCDACLRVGGSSKGADEEVARFRAAGKPVYYNLDELPKKTFSQNTEDR